MSSEEVIELQSKVAELELTTLRQSEEIYRLQQRCDTLELQIKSVINTVKTQRTGYGDEVPIDRPPHY